MRHPHPPTLPQVNGHADRPLPDTLARHGVSNHDLARTLGLHRPRGHRAVWHYGAFMLIVALLAMGGWFMVNKGTTSGLTYRTEVVQQGRLSVTVTATGTLEPVNQVAVGSELSGTIATVEVDYNDRVTRGQILARLNKAQLQARVVQSQASLAAAMATLQQAAATVAEIQQKVARSQALAARGLLAEQDLEADQARLARAEAEAANVQAQIDLARARLAADRTDLNKAVIRSPIDGVVLSRDVEPGQTVAASFQTPTLFTLAEDLTRMTLHADIDEADIGQVREGQEATFTVDAYPGRPFTARIVAIRNAPQTIENVVTYETILAVDNPERQLRPGMTATAEIITQRVESALLVPNGALRFTPPRHATQGTVSTEPLRSEVHTERVWVLRDDMPVPIEVTTGLSDGRLTQVLSGDIAPGLALLIDVQSDTGAARHHARSRR